MKLTLVLISILLLVACAGKTTYRVETPDGVVVDVENTKDYESYELNAKKNPDGSYSVKLKETGVSASNPLKAARETNAKLIDKILSVIPGAPPAE